MSASNEAPSQAEQPDDIPSSVGQDPDGDVEEHIEVSAGAARPAFSRAYPPDAELDELVRAFDRGDFATVRRRAPELAERTKDDEVKAAALDLRRRIEPSPTALILIGLGLTLLLFLFQHHLRHAP